MKTFLAFAAHPDDLEFSCTGMMMRLVEEGYRGIYVIITNGENGFKAGKVSADQRVEIRKQEQLRAAEMVGITKVKFLDHVDGFLEYSESLRRRLVEIIKQYKPEIVLSWDPANRDFDNLNLLHRDHRICAEMVFDACFAAKNLHMYEGDAHRVGHLYFYGSNKPNYYEDISGRMNKKLDILRNHASQFPDFSKVDKFIRELNSNPDSGFTYSEAFRVMEVVQVT